MPGCVRAHVRMSARAIADGCECERLGACVRAHVRASASAMADGCECERLGACVRMGAHAYSRACKCAGDRG